MNYIFMSITKHILHINRLLAHYGLKFHSLKSEKTVLNGLVYFEYEIKHTLY